MNNSKLLTILLLLWIAWPGPRLVVHSHNEYSGLRGVERLAHHRAMWHPSVPPSDTRSDHPDDETDETEELGLHLHWVFGGLGDSNEATSSMFPVVHAKESWGTTQRLCDLDFDLALDQIMIDRTARLIDFGYRTATLANHQPSVRFVQLLYCVWTC